MRTDSQQPQQPVDADLFNWNSRYPNQAGYKAAETSAEAATEIEESGRAGILREKVLRLFRAGKALTADECAAALDESVLSIRPRLSELKGKCLIKDSGERRENASGKRAIVWVNWPSEQQVSA